MHPAKAFSSAQSCSELSFRNYLKFGEKSPFQGKKQHFLTLLSTKTSKLLKT